MNFRAFKIIDIIWQSLSIAGTVWVLLNVWQIGLMIFFIAMGLAQTTSLLVHIMSKEAQITQVRKWLHRGMYLAFGLLILQIVIMQLSAATGRITIIGFGIYTGLLMLIYYVNTLIELFSKQKI